MVSRCGWQAVCLGLLLAGMGGCTRAGHHVTTLNLSLILQQDSDWYRGAAKFKQLVEDRTQGQVVVKVFPGAQLANRNQRTEMEMVQSGALDMSLESSILLSGLDPKFSAFSMPWLFPDYETASRVCDGELGRQMLDLLPAKQMVGLAYGVNGFRQVTNSRHPIRTPEDLKDLKIRVPGIKMYIDLFRLLGADPSSMNFGELFTALKEGAMDGQENPLAVIEQAKLYEVQKYVSVWNYSYDPIILCMNKAKWEGFDADTQKVLKECAVTAMSVQRKLVVDGEPGLMNTLHGHGMEVTVLSADEIARFKPLADPVYDTYRDIIGADLLQAFRDAAASSGA